ncbi:MAG: V-type ATP synthase subunit K [Clostridia bacterium]|nr:V-type ATP synthase subunit K [Clostridia bacterium]
MESTISMTLWDLLGKFLLNGQVLAVIGAALAAILPGFGSAKAVGSVGEALDGLMSEDPDKFGKGFLLEALPATQGLYGVIVAFIVITKVGVLGGTPVANIEQGLYYFFACMPIAFVGYYSAIRQGRVASAGVATIAKRPDASGKCVIATAMVELYALFALIVSFVFVFFPPFGA